MLSTSPPEKITAIVCLIFVGAFGGALATDPPLGGVQVGLGVQCIPRGSEQPRGPISYEEEDIGKRGVPKLSKSELAEVTRLRHIGEYGLRFVFLRDIDLKPHRRRLILFSADNGPCYAEAPGYKVLNENNSYYEPGEEPDSTTAGPPPDF